MHDCGAIFAFCHLPHHSGIRAVTADEAFETSCGKPLLTKYRPECRFVKKRQEQNWL
jgi:hypothetical protein